jgi:ribosomal protein S27E
MVPPRTPSFAARNPQRLVRLPPGEARLRRQLASLCRAAMGKAADWLREERRKTLGDWVAFCIACGFTQRYFEEWKDQLATACPTCGGELRSQCPECGERFSSAFAVECEACGGELRPPELFGTAIRKR